MEEPYRLVSIQATTKNQVVRCFCSNAPAWLINCTVDIASSTGRPASFGTRSEAGRPGDEAAVAIYEFHFQVPQCILQLR